MGESITFTYNGRPCAISFSKERKEFFVDIYPEEESLFPEKSISLFPVDRFSKSQQMTAYHVANRHILHHYINRGE